MSHPFVSVLVSSYNYARYLPAALDSVLAQTWPHLELIVVDDGSTDHSLAIARAAALRDGRVRVVTHSDGGNHGLVATMQLGLARCRGDYVAFLESPMHSPFPPTVGANSHPPRQPGAWV